ncbi:apolipoprotein N-acyltransferase [Dinghuibacter silviterrae]|uniref:Apolipoprotein N-acyltransferase n=1 Tax=Dinghuibacter silviterrae TaxID=1539049 RepID=A0A4V3GKN0_9BACT|nr:apolipoprotein N-acyltransferase [Dinghuibacter silviterrae]TDW96332.1 apolipoprotein N-acyltransferase [Dinghuibacter silviterrae]
MRTYRFRLYLAASLAGVGIFFAVLHTVFALAWVCMVPLFAALEGARRGDAAKLGFVTGLTLSLCAFYWMIPGAQTFTGSSIWYGVAVFAVCTLLLSLYWAILAACSRGVLAAAALWVCAEAGLQWLAKGMPWFLFHSGNALAGNLYAIQPISWTGIHGATFVVVAVNAVIGRCVAKRDWKGLWMPAAAIAVYMGIGWGILETRQEPRGPYFSLALLSEQITPDVQWDSNSGGQLVGRLLDLDRAAAAQKPDMALWSESAIPWTYKEGDDLVGEILRQSPGVIHILGMNTACAEGVVYNSAYCFRQGLPPGRYDKQVLLLGIEQRWRGWLIPFFSSNGYEVRKGPYAAPLETPFGAAGILICNESAVPACAASAVRGGARFLLNLSNDGWFSDTYLVDQHFTNVRLRAVETRRDIAVNSNNGITGLVSASGRIQEARRSDDPYVSIVRVYPHDGETLAVRVPWLPVALCGLFLLFFYCFHIIKRLNEKLK